MEGTGNNPSAAAGTGQVSGNTPVAGSVRPDGDLREHETLTDILQQIPHKVH